MNKIYNAAVYLRLSREDGDVVSGGKIESNSISNQKELVTDYLKSHPDLKLYSIYTDDGYSGVNFERPEFQRMLNDIRSGAVNCVVVKDLSRFGRNYIESGRYIEKIFPMLGVRFIAITDNYDSVNETYGNDMIVPFKNLINDAYCRDISIKIRSHMDIKRRNGEYIGAFAAYGYLKDPKNKNHLIVDEYAADVVRDIFAMKLCGLSLQAIADKLNSEGTLSPIQYKKSIGVPLESSFQKAVKPGWSYNAVLRILQNEVYTGTTVQGKSTTPNYKIKKRVHIDKCDWVRVEKTHDAIVSQYDFRLVQSLLRRDTRVSPDSGRLYPLAGLVFCGDCGAAMWRKVTTYKGKKYFYYACSGNKKDKGSCSCHSISEEKLQTAILEMLKNHVKNILSLARAVEIINQAPEESNRIQLQDARIEKLKEELAASAKHQKNLYEDYRDGILSRDEYVMLKEQYERDDDRIQDAVRKIEQNRADILANKTLKSEWLDMIRKYEDAGQLDRNMVISLIDKIEIYEHGVISIHYRFEDEAKLMESYVSAHQEREAG